LFVELFGNRQEDDTKRLLFDYWGGEKRIIDEHYSSVKRETNPLIAMETFILP
jgi:hypothetical protein